MLHTLDWVVIALFLSVSLIVGLVYRKRGGRSLSDFFLGGRNLPWYIAGISMVATTFAADTPLLVTEIVRANGVSSNWLWWNMLIGGMLTTFFFARLWRRAEVLTELEFIELRYSGKVASFLRGFKAVYLGVFLNSLVIGWVNFALMKIIAVFFNIPEENVIWIVAAAMLFTTFYSSLSGLWGVAVTDAIQFTFAMTGCIILAVIVVNLEEVGGIDGLKEKLPESAFSIFPAIGMGTGDSLSMIPQLSIGFFTFFSYVAIQWWASWYPGAEPGGGGYVAQRMMSAKNEKHALFATLFFQIAHYCLRPWPWIIVALCTIILYPGLAQADYSEGYVMAMKDHLPVGLKGLLLASFLGAYMSTISTQLNWGASFLTNDLYRRFIRNDRSANGEESRQKNYVVVGRISTALIMLVSLYITTLLETIKEAWEFILGAGAGLGMVLILRWYWWRVSAWSELAATLAPFIGFGIAKFYLEEKLGSGFTDNNGSFYFTVIFTTVVWILVTIIHRPAITDHMIAFYNKVRPEGSWKPVNQAIGVKPPRTNIDYLLGCWICAVLMTYSCLFLTGKIIFKEWTEAGIWTFAGLVSFAGLRYFMKKAGIYDK